MFDTLGEFLPIIIESGIIDNTFFSSKSLEVRVLDKLNFWAYLAAAPKPIIWFTASVPPLKPLSCPPPIIIGDNIV